MLLPIVIIVIVVVVWLIATSTNESSSKKSNDTQNTNASKDTFDVSVKKTLIKDETGNVKGSATTYSYGGKYGEFSDTTYKDNLGNVKGEIKTTKL